jgi:hypothetical protein
VTATICASFSPETGDCEREATEYFTRGTVSAQTYVMQAPPPDGQQMASVEIRREVLDVAPTLAISPPAPPVVSEVPPSPAEVVAAAADQNAPKKKRGFWGKVFGR